jgi:hypothetical protein
MASTKQRIAIVRPEGVTDTERQLKRLADHTFLSLWSYPEVRSDRGMIDGKGPGKEVCDLLVVSGNDVIIFSDKRSDFQADGDLQTAWNRWFRGTIKESVDQVRGAERWIKSYPHRLFVDRACRQPFPLPIPDPAVARYHRVIVPHGASERCQRELGGRGSLRIVPDIIGPMHLACLADRAEPFAVGQLDPDFGFIHVLDDTTIELVLAELDTITDLLSYFSWKERLIQNGRLERAASEADLVAFYLEQVRVTDQYVPELPAGSDRIVVREGLWDDYARSPERQARRGANESSFVVDRLIEQFGRNAYARTEHSASTPGVAGAATILRFLAAEPRTRRRGIGRELEKLLVETPESHFSAMTVIHPTLPGEPCYVLLLVSAEQQGLSYEDYREFRLWMLSEYCRAVRYQFPSAEDIIGIATEVGLRSGRSEDAIYYDGRRFTEQDAIEAQKLIDSTGALQSLKHSAGIESYFPKAE